MADVKATPPPAENEQQQQPKRSSGNRGGHRRGGSHKGQGENQAENDQDGSIGRKKKPELEHYKPGAFASRKPGDEEHNDSEEPHQSQHHHKKNHHHRNSNKKQVDQISEKVGSMSMDTNEKGKNHRHRGGERKKPDQAHYVPKKSENNEKDSDKPEKQRSDRKNKDRSKNGGKPKNKPEVVQESQRNGHLVESTSEADHHRPHHRNKSSNNTRRNNNEQQQPADNNLPPRMRQHEHNGGRSDRGRNKKDRGGKRNYERNFDRESSSPMVSSEARSPSPGNQPRRDSASSSRHNRRSYSPQNSAGHRNVVSPTSYRGRNNHGSSRGNGRGNNRGHRYDYHNRGEAVDWRYNHEAVTSKDGSSQPKSLPPRFQKNKGDQDYREWSHQQNRRTRPMKDYEVDDSRVYDYEKDEDDDCDPQPASRVADWSLEVEEEEERLSHMVNKASEKKGGILRLPPDHAMASSNNDWRAHPPPPQQQQQPHHHHQQQQYSRSDHYGNHYNENPAWRGMDHQYGQQRPSSERYLYDPRNPKKPIPAAGHRNVRVPLDPRFAHPPNANNNSGPRLAGYRPPFPANNSSMQASVMMNEPGKNESEAAQILGANELRLMGIVQSGGPQKLCQLWHHDVAEARQNIMRTFRVLLQTDLVFCARFDVEFFVWKICFYNLVATLKTWLAGGTIPQAERGIVEDNVIELLDQGLEFYSEMLETLDKTYHIGLEQYYDVLEPRSGDTKIRCALVSAQKCLLCLGDLARYKEMIQNTSNYGKARQYYQKASHIDTRNAKPFNQLAILAWTAKRKFEAVYYHMRCLQTKSPVESSRQSLVEIFEDIRKRWDVSEKKRMEERAQRKKEADSERDRMHLIKGTRLRKEIWIRPDGGRRLHRTTSAQEGAPDSEEAELKEMSTTELNRRFNNAFLHLVGTLYTHINIDAFPIGCDLLQKEFRILLSRSPLPIDCKRLVQIMALNMFIIEHTKMKSNSEEYVSVTQNYALQLAFEMFGILVERCNDLLLSFIPATATDGLSSIFHDDDLPNLLSAVKVWCDWLMGNNDTWFPVLCDEPFNELAKLATHLEKLKPIISPILRQCLNEHQYQSLPVNELNQYEMIKLDEDAVLCGFTPWTLGVNWNIYRRFAPRTVPTTLLQDARRLDAINFCVDFLEGLEPPVLKWSPPDSAHISLVENVGSTADKVNAKLTHMLSREQDILEESYSDNEESKDKSDPEVVDRNSKIGQLKSRKEELERRRKEEEETRKLQQQILSEHVSVTLEVCPKLVVPDTNCFVDYLPEIGRLAGQFQLRVPIVVLKELDGLAKGARPAKYASPEHAAMVAENARHALTFLKNRPANTRCVTSRGTVLASLGVTTEDDVQQMDKNNDDLILDACINLAMHKEEIRGDMRVVYRDLVLLTDDRNLKLKAHMTDIPVNKLSDFIHWAYST